jgi:hypothetical protein
MEDIPAAVLEDCVQLVKANSIQGSKQPTVNIVYTPWSNLKKTGDMDIGQVGFVSQQKVLTSLSPRLTTNINHPDLIDAHSRSFSFP